MTATVIQKDEKDLTKFAFALDQLAQGRSNAVGSCTLTANAASTVVAAINCGAGSMVFLMPKTANAAGALATTYIATVAAGSFTITHANDANADKTFGYVCLG